MKHTIRQRRHQKPPTATSVALVLAQPVLSGKADRGGRKTGITSARQRRLAERQTKRHQRLTTVALSVTA